VKNDTVQARVDGFDPNLPVTLEMKDADTVVVTVGDAGQSAFFATVDGVSAGTSLNVSNDLTANHETLIVTQPTGRNIKIILIQFPEGTNVGLDLGETQQILSSVTNAAGQALEVDIQVQDSGGDITFTITYHPPKSNGTAKTVWLAPGGSMTIEAEGIPADGMYKLAVKYANVPLGRTAEQDLRLMRVNADASLSVISAADCGNQPATGILGDYGIETAAKQVWANVDSLGTFAVGVPKEPVQVVTTTVTGYGCPGLSGILFGLLFLGFAGLKW
jgi:hypothetical protein